MRILNFPSKELIEYKMAKTFKESWNEVDERCPHCNNVTKKVIGMKKQNLKKLFSKPTLQDVIVFIMLAACLFLTWSYYNNVSQYQAIIENPGEFCTMYYNQLSQNSEITLYPLLKIPTLNTSFKENG